MIDVHNHSLYGLDDGSKCLEQTIAMMKIAYDEGIRSIILTPHYKEDRYTKNKEYVAERIKSLQLDLKREGIDIALYQGNEVFYYCDCTNEIEEKQLATLAGSRYVLIEFYPSTDYHTIKESLNHVLNSGYLPILAHVERYTCLVEHYKLTEELVDMGVYIQVNCSSIIGNHGRTIKKFTKKLLKKHWVNFVATDAHSDGTRSPRMRECYEYVTKKFGSEYADDLVYHNPMKILTKEYL